MRRGRTWANEYWDVLAIGLGLATALVLGSALGVAYNVVMLRSAPASIEAGPAPAAPPPVPDPLRPAPYS
jgi:hypothetical protein